MTFLDTNVCLDLISRRSPWHTAAEKLISTHIIKSIPVGVSVISIPTIAYLLDKHYKTIKTKDTLRQMMLLIDLLDVNKKITETAIFSSWADIEDAIQYGCAIYHRANCIVTRNKKDFKKSNIPVFTPDEWLIEFDI